MLLGLELIACAGSTLSWIRALQTRASRRCEAVAASSRIVGVGAMLTERYQFVLIGRDRGPASEGEAFGGVTERVRCS